MRIDSILPNLASPGQSVVIHGEGLEAAERIFFGDQETSFEIDGEVLLVKVPDGSGEVEVVVEGRNDQSEVVIFTIA